MRAVLQKVASAFVTAEEQTLGKIGRGVVALIGVMRDDTEEDIRYLCDKIAEIRIFDDENGVPNRSVQEIGGQVLLISQFTICADARHGRRPSYFHAAPAEVAQPLYEKGINLLREKGIAVETGKFQTDMQVSLVNDGPMTILLDSRRIF